MAWNGRRAPETRAPIPKSPPAVVGPAVPANRPVPPLRRRFRQVWCSLFPPDSYADAAYIIAVVKGPQRNCVFTATCQGYVQRISFMRAVGNTIVRKDFVPRAAIDAHVRGLDATGRVLDVKNRAGAFVSNLRAANLANHRRRVVDVHRLAEALTRQGVGRRMIGCV